MTHRSLQRTLRFVLLASACAIVPVGCGHGGEQPAGDEGRSAGEAQPGPTPPGVTFEPAYPADVSREGLSPQDAAQQEMPHSHDGGAEHTHADEPDQGEGEGDHGHPH
jgi:hypothetical protein